jgi:hypothetical protein
MFKGIIQPVWVGIALVSLALTPLAACGDDDDDTTDTGADTTADDSAQSGSVTTGGTEMDGSGASDTGDTDADGGTNTNTGLDTTAGGATGDTVADDGETTGGTGADTAGPFGFYVSDLAAFACGAGDASLPASNVALAQYPVRYTRGVLLYDDPAEPMPEGFPPSDDLLDLYLWYNDLSASDTAFAGIGMPGTLKSAVLGGSAPVQLEGQSKLVIAPLFVAECNAAECEPAAPDDPTWLDAKGTLQGQLSGRYGECDIYTGTLDASRANDLYAADLDGPLAVPAMSFGRFYTALTNLANAGL